MIDPELMQARLAQARVARLATMGTEGRPHVVPVCFALVEERIVSVVDFKPKRSSRLRRLDNIRANPDVEVVVDHYEEDWRRLWWIRARGRATILEEGREWERALAGLTTKYPQYRLSRPTGPVISIRVEVWSAWSGDGSETPRRPFP